MKRGTRGHSTAAEWNTNFPVSESLSDIEPAVQDRSVNGCIFHVSSDELSQHNIDVAVVSNDLQAYKLINNQ